MINTTKNYNDSAREYLANYTNNIKFISAGFEKVDSAINGGFYPNSIVTIGANLSAEKDLFLTAFIKRQQSDKRRTLFFSLDKSGFADGLKKSDCLFVHDKTSVDYMTTAINAAKPEIVLIDNFQQIQSNSGLKDKRSRCIDIALRLKTAARKANCCLVFLSDVYQDFRTAPKMCDLKDCGVLEEISNYVVMLYRPCDIDGVSAEPERVIAAFEKNHFGKPENFVLHFDELTAQSII